MDNICQREYDQSRSAGCAAAILEHFYHTGISVFTDYKRYPNRVLYHKIFDALENYTKKESAENYSSASYFLKHPHHQIHAVSHMIKRGVAVQIHRNLHLRVA